VTAASHPYATAEYFKLPFRTCLRSVTFATGKNVTRLIQKELQQTQFMSRTEIWAAIADVENQATLYRQRTANSDMYNRCLDPEFTATTADLMDGAAGGPCLRLVATNSTLGSVVMGQTLEARQFQDPTPQQMASFWGDPPASTVVSEEGGDRRYTHHGNGESERAASLGLLPIQTKFLVTGDDPVTAPKYGATPYVTMDGGSADDSLYLFQLYAPHTLQTHGCPPGSDQAPCIVQMRPHDGKAPAKSSMGVAEWPVHAGAVLELLLLTTQPVPGSTCDFTVRRFGMGWSDDVYTGDYSSYSSTSSSSSSGTSTSHGNTISDDLRGNLTIGLRRWTPMELHHLIPNEAGGTDYEDLLVAFDVDVNQIMLDVSERIAVAYTAELQAVDNNASRVQTVPLTERMTLHNTRVEYRYTLFTSQNGMNMELKRRDLAGETSNEICASDCDPTTGMSPVMVKTTILPVFRDKDHAVTAVEARTRAYWDTIQTTLANQTSQHNSVFRAIEVSPRESVDPRVLEEMGRYANLDPSVSASVPDYRRLQYDHLPETNLRDLVRTGYINQIGGTALIIPGLQSKHSSSHQATYNPLEIEDDVWPLVRTHAEYVANGGFERRSGVHPIGFDAAHVSEGSTTCVFAASAGANRPATQADCGVWGGADALESLNVVPLCEPGYTPSPEHLAADDLAGATDDAFMMYRSIRRNLEASRLSSFKALVADAHDKGLRVFPAVSIASRTAHSTAVHYFQFRDASTDRCSASGGGGYTVMCDRSLIFDRRTAAGLARISGHGGGHLFIGSGHIGGTNSLWEPDTISAQDDNYDSLRQVRYAGQTPSDSGVAVVGYRLNPTMPVVRNSILAQIHMYTNRAGVDGIVLDVTEFLESNSLSSTTDSRTVPIPGARQVMQLIQQLVGPSSMLNPGTQLIATNLDNAMNIRPGLDHTYFHTYQSGQGCPGLTGADDDITDGAAHSHHYRPQDAIRTRVCGTESAFFGQERVPLMAQPAPPVMLGIVCADVAVGSTVIPISQTWMDTTPLGRLPFWDPLERTQLPRLSDFNSPPPLLGCLSHEHGGCIPATAAVSAFAPSWTESSLTTTGDAGFFAPSRVAVASDMIRVLKSQQPPSLTTPDLTTPVGFANAAFQWAQVVRGAHTSTDGAHRDVTHISQLVSTTSGFRSTCAFSIRVWSLDPQTGIPKPDHKALYVVANMCRRQYSNDVTTDAQGTSRGSGYLLMPIGIRNDELTGPTLHTVYRAEMTRFVQSLENKWSDPGQLDPLPLAHHGQWVVNGKVRGKLAYLAVPPQSIYVARAVVPLSDMDRSGYSDGTDETYREVFGTSTTPVRDSQNNAVSTTSSSTLAPVAPPSMVPPPNTHAPTTILDWFNDTMSNMTLPPSRPKSDSSTLVDTLVEVVAVALVVAGLIACVCGICGVRQWCIVHCCHGGEIRYGQIENNPQHLMPRGMEYYPRQQHSDFRKPTPEFNHLKPVFGP
jgi:hypothetical protein